MEEVKPPTKAKARTPAKKPANTPAEQQASNNIMSLTEFINNNYVKNKNGKIKGYDIYKSYKQFTNIDNYIIFQFYKELKLNNIEVVKENNINYILGYEVK